jgi:hypothetical protein
MLDSGDIATTGEHKKKRSDLREVFGAPTQAASLFYHDGRMKNRPSEASMRKC